VAVYEIGGAHYELPDDITQEQLQGVVAQLGGANPAASAPSSAHPDATVLDEAKKGLVNNSLDAAHPLVRGAGAVANAIADVSNDPSISDRVKRNMQNIGAWFSKWHGENVPAVPSVTDIQSPHDAALYAASKAGGAAPYLGAALAGGVPAAAALGGAVGADQAYDATGGDLTATAAGGVLGAAAGAAPVPFMKGGSGSFVSGAVRGAAGAAATSPLQVAAQTIPQAIASGDPTDAIPSGAQLADAAAGGAITGAMGGAAAHPRLPDLPNGQGLRDAARRAADAIPSLPERTPGEDAGTRQRLSQRILEESQGTRSNLNDVEYGSRKGAEQVLENVHNSIAEEIKGLAASVKPLIDPAHAASLDELIDRTGISASLRDARNKRKSTVSETDFDRLGRYVGHLQEGRSLIDTMRQSNELTDLFREGLKGGVSKYTDKVAPWGEGFTSQNPLVRAFDNTPLRIAGAAAAGAINPAIPAAQAGLWGAGRLIDRATGRRSRVARYVNENVAHPEAQPVNMTGARSILGDAAAQRATTAENDARLVTRERELRTQNRMEDNPGLGGFDRSIYDQTGLRPQEAQRGVFDLFRQGKITPEEFRAFFNAPRDLMAGNAGNHVMDMLDAAARRGQLARDPEWRQAAPEAASARPQSPTSAYDAQARGNQERVTAAQDRVASSELPDEVRQAVSTAIGRVGKTNNRIDAAKVRNDTVKALPEEHRAAALAEIDPLVRQIRHATPEEARAAAPPRARPMRRSSAPEGGLNAKTDRLVAALVDRAKGIEAGKEYPVNFEGPQPLIRPKLQPTDDRVTKARVASATLRIKAMPGGGRIVELNPGEKAASVFHDAIQAAHDANEHGAAVTVYPAEDYAGMRTFLSPDAKFGFALKGEDVVSVFKHPDANEKGVGEKMAKLAVQEGGRTLDAFDTVLPGIYAKAGFKPVARLPWSDDYAPTGWNYDAFAQHNGGRPDVVFMAHDPAHDGSYRPEDAPVAKDYDAAVARQQAALGRSPQLTQLDAKGDTPDRISTRLPTGKRSTEDPLAENLTIGLKEMEASPTSFVKNMGVVEGYTNYRPAKSADTPQKVARRFVDHVVDNLLWLHDQIDPATRDRSKLWYDGARAITDKWSQRYQLPDRAIAGVMAVLSPQKDWFQNVSLAERALDITTQKGNHTWDEKMTATADRIYGKDQYREALGRIEGKKFNELTDPIEKAMWVRTYDEAHHSKSYRLVSPEGNFEDFVKTAKGANQKMAWGSNVEIAKAIAIIENPTREVVSEQTGDQHKVRNFYNNIIAPKSEHGDVTIDTHAVAAGLLKPLSSKSLEVDHNFGSTSVKGRQGVSSSSITGQQGLYGLYAEAYRKAADLRGILPREMQSITWEAVRGLFTPKFKANRQNVAAIENVWKAHRKGKMSLDEARKQILDQAGGIAPPDWTSGPAGGVHAEARDRSYEG
jgi:hypothetical protein